MVPKAGDCFVEEGVAFPERGEERGFIYISPDQYPDPPHVGRCLGEIEAVGRLSMCD